MVFDGLRPICHGVCVPKEKVIEHHCEKNQDIFEKWWGENGKKRRDDITDVPDCLELNDNLVRLNNLIQLTEDVFEKIKG